MNQISFIHKARRKDPNSRFSVDFQIFFTYNLSGINGRTDADLMTDFRHAVLRTMNLWHLQDSECQSNLTFRWKQSPLIWHPDTFQHLRWREYSLIWLPDNFQHHRWKQCPLIWIPYILIHTLISEFKKCGIPTDLLNFVKWFCAYNCWNSFLSWIHWCQLYCL